MTIVLTGLVHIAGEMDTGKTTFALESGASPDRIAFFDGDIKASATAKELHDASFPFGAYFDLVTMGAKKRELEFHQMCLGLIGGISSGDFDVIIWDTWTRFANTCHPYVLAHPQEFRQRWSPMGTIKGAQQWNAAHNYEATLLAELCALVPLVIITTHLKQAYRGNQPIPGKFTPACKRAVIRKSRLRVWLRRNPDSPKPIGLVLKRLSRPTVTESGIRTVNVLPLRLKPCTWDTIAEYMENPIGDRQPRPDETPNAFELSLLQGTLTPDQERTFQLMLRQGVLEPEIEEPVPTTWQELLTRLNAVGKSTTLDDLGGVAVAMKMTQEEIEEKWEELR